MSPREVVEVGDVWVPVRNPPLPCQEYSGDSPRPGLGDASIGDTSPEYSGDEPCRAALGDAESARALGDASPGPRGPGERRCQWCGVDLPATGRKFCGVGCRKRAFRLRSRRQTDERAGRPMVLAYADPPYPGLSKRYYGSEPTFAGEGLGGVKLGYHPQRVVISTSVPFEPPREPRPRNELPRNCWCIRPNRKEKLRGIYRGPILPGETGRRRANDAAPE